jgi:hypothetical protein
VLGAYGFRGFFEKAAFHRQHTAAIDNLRDLLQLREEVLHIRSA